MEQRDRSQQKTRTIFISPALLEHPEEWLASIGLYHRVLTVALAMERRSRVQAPYPSLSVRTGLPGFVQFMLPSHLHSPMLQRAVLRFHLDRNTPRSCGMLLLVSSAHETSAFHSRRRTSRAPRSTRMGFQWLLSSGSSKRSRYL